MENYLYNKYIPSGEFIKLNCITRTRRSVKNKSHFPSLEHVSTEMSDNGAAAMMTLIKY